ncbi:hypothetical protein B0A50_02085 [Salinomyces thailandicus]|uniref:ORC6 first cyclin-like domain-containing protein n=1 Tax=Salinomyces thailandicus TaxID=706561 RepID=A0A4U0U9I5_9PEZI|nr:hypothetical protein B0A50_02085 [Salinomyces thailandica]
MPHPVELALQTLLPTLSPLPSPLIALSHALLAQSRSRAASLKPDEEIARTFACCHIACERLGKRYGLEISGSGVAPVGPRVYAKLKVFLGMVLRTPGRSGGEKAEMTMAVGQGKRGAATKTLGAGTSPGKNVVRTPTSGRKRKMQDVEASVVQAEGSAAAEVGAEEDGRHAGTSLEPRTQDDNANSDHDNCDDEDEPFSPVSRPAKTPLRRREKHACRRVEGPENPGPSGLLPGLGTMFQPAVDWLGEERRERHRLWEKAVFREIGALESKMSMVA